MTKQGWRVFRPHVRVPEGCELREDEDVLYLYRGDELLGRYSMLIRHLELEQALEWAASPAPNPRTGVPL